MITMRTDFAIVNYKAVLWRKKAGYWLYQCIISVYLAKSAKRHFLNPQSQFRPLDCNFAIAIFSAVRNLMVTFAIF
jgi:hypothetical protein